MDSFLRTIAARIAREHPDDADHTLVVFNNRRSLRFFQRQFVGLGRPMFLPRCMAIDDLIAELGGLEIVPNEFLLFELYSIHLEKEGDERKYKTFEEFISFGDLMLGDFSMLDQYCVDARDLFGNLHDLKAIGEWDIEGSQLSDFQRRYLHFYHSLYDYYQSLHNRLLKANKAYGGMAYRHVAENINTLAEHVDASAVYFVGFNALSECERRIISEFVQRGKGHLLTDGDTYFMQPEQEAGHFLRKHCAEFPEIEPKGPSLFAQGPRSITIVECPEQLLQCKWSGQLLESHPEWLCAGQQERTAVVLADENLLLPALNALPEGDYGVNISMGYAFSDSNMHLLAQRLIALHATANERGYHHAAILDLLSLHSVQTLLGTNTVRNHIATWMSVNNIIRCSGKELRQMLDGRADALGIFPDHPLDVEGCLEALRNLVAAIQESGVMERNRKEMQAAGSMMEMVDYLQRLQHTYHYIDNLDTLRKIYLRLAQRHQIALIGEPLSGLQVMGMLETRNLDFDRVVLLSAGEGTLPASRTASTLIPYELQRQFNLPTYQEKDSVYAYNFYHLLLRAKEVYLVYSSQSEAMGKGEPSRFIRQVECELAPRFDIEVNHLVVNNNQPATVATPIPDGSLPKSKAVADHLQDLAADGFTPTGFDDFLQCPLRYYYTRVLNIREQETLDDDLDASHLGSCIHNILQGIYTPWIADDDHPNRSVPADALRQALKDLPNLMDAEFEKFFRHGRSTDGRNRFMYSVAKTQLGNLLKREASLIEKGHCLQILSLEEMLPAILLGNDPYGHPIRLRGKADRIDRIDGQLRIIDYKTGSVKPEEIAFKSTPNRMGEIPIPGKWFQLMCYALLYRENKKITSPLQAGIYPLRNLQADVQLASCDGHTELGEEDFLNFRQQLTDMCLQLLNPDEPFRPSRHQSDCSYCDVRTFCPLHP